MRPEFVVYRAKTSPSSSNRTENRCRAQRVPDEETQVDPCRADAKFLHRVQAPIQKFQAHQVLRRASAEIDGHAVIVAELVHRQPLFPDALVGELGNGCRLEPPCVVQPGAVERQQIQLAALQGSQAAAVDGGVAVQKQIAQLGHSGKRGNRRR